MVIIMSNKINCKPKITVRKKRSYNNIFNLSGGYDDFKHIALNNTLQNT